MFPTLSLYTSSHIPPPPCIQFFHQNGKSATPGHHFGTIFGCVCMCIFVWACMNLHIYASISLCSFHGPGRCIPLVVLIFMYVYISGGQVRRVKNGFNFGTLRVIFFLRLLFRGLLLAVGSCTAFGTGEALRSWTLSSDRQRRSL